jgi:hypothetical protein
MVRLNPKMHIARIDSMAFGVADRYKKRKYSENQDDQSHREQTSHAHLRPAFMLFCENAELCSAKVQMRPGGIELFGAGDNCQEFPNSRANSTKLLTAIPDGPLAIQGLLSSIQAVPAISR